MAKIYGYDIHAQRVTTAKLLAKHLWDKEWAVREMLDQEAKEKPEAPVRQFDELLDIDKRQLLLEFCLEDVDSILETWLFDYYIPHNRRWLPPMTTVQCEEIVSITISDKIYDDVVLVPKLAQHLICAFNELLGELVPSRSWREVMLLWNKSNSDSLTIMMGEDYRIRWFMENVTTDEGYVVETDFRQVLKDVQRNTHSDEVIIRMSKDEFEALGVVNFKED